MPRDQHPPQQFVIRTKVLLWSLFVLIFPALFASPSLSVESAFVDLAIERNILSAVAVAGDQFNWQLTAKIVNTENSAEAKAVVVHELLPAGVTLLEARPSAGTCVEKAEGSLTGYQCELERLDSSTQAVIDVSVLISPNFLFKAVFSTAFIEDQGGSVDLQLANNISRLDQAVAFRPPTLDLLVSPLCTTTGSTVLITGDDLKRLYATNPAVAVNGLPAQAVFFGETALSVTIPEISETTAQLSINGIALTQTLQIDPSCALRSISVDDLREGFVAGDLLLFFKSDLSDDEIAQFKSRYAFESLSKYPLLGIYRGRLSQNPGVSAVETDPELIRACPVLKRRSALEMDLTLLVDLSGTMDSVELKRLLHELMAQLKCVYNIRSDLSLITYRDQPAVELEAAPWENQQAVLEDWVSSPIATEGQSNLERALHFAADRMKEHPESARPKGIFVITRGPSIPQWSDESALYTTLREGHIGLSGIAMTNLLLPRRFYEPLQALAHDSGKELVFFDERSPRTLSESISCAIAAGIYGLESCGPDSLSRIPGQPVDYSRQTEILLEQIARDERVDQICLNSLIENQQYSDPNLADQGWLQNLGVQNIQSFFPRLGDGVSIAIIDTGVDLDLGQLGELEIDPSVPAGLSFATTGAAKSADGSDVVGHGTSVASITAAHGNNGLNGAGVAPKASIIPIRVFASEAGTTKGNSLWVAEALAAAYLMNVDVINMSLGDQARVKIACAKFTSEDFYKRILNNISRWQEQIGLTKKPILVAATGNDGRRVRCPACLADVLAVGSVKQGESGAWERSSFSNYGPQTDLVAQGEGVNTTLDGGQFGETGPGTSFSAPQVAGLVALILGEEPHLTFEGVLERIKACFVQDVGSPGFDDETGWGRIFIPDPNAASPTCLASKND